MIGQKRHFSETGESTTSIGEDSNTAVQALEHGSRLDFRAGMEPEHTAGKMPIRFNLNQESRSRLGLGSEPVVPASLPRVSCVAYSLGTG